MRQHEEETMSEWEVMHCVTRRECRISGSWGLLLSAQIIFVLSVYPTPYTPYFPKDPCSKWSDFVPESQIIKHLKITMVGQAKF